MPQIDINLRSTADTSGFSQTTAASANLSKSVNYLGNRLEHMFTGRHLATAVATAVGINIEKIAQEIARFATGMSEVEEKAYKSIEALSDKAAELALKNMRANLSGEQQLALAVRERNRLQWEIENSHATTAVQQEEILKKRIQLEERISEIHSLEAKNTPEMRAQAELASIALRVQTVAADQTRTDYQKREQEISLMQEELDVRSRLIAIIQTAKLVNGETATTRDAKVEKLQEENRQLRNKLNALNANESADDKSGQETHDKYSQFKSQQGGGVNLNAAMRDGAENWVVKMGSLSSQVAESIENTIGRVVSSISDGILSWVDGTKTFGQAMAAIGQGILKAILGDIIQIGVKMMINAVLGRVLSAASAASSLATAAAVAVPMAAIWAVPATLATIATLGGAAAQAPLSIMGAEGSVLATTGFALGGMTGGDTSQIRGFVHGGEWVAPEWMVRHPGFGQVIAGLEGARNGSPGFDMGGLTSPGGSLTRPAYMAPPPQAPTVNILLDPAQFARLQQEHSAEWFQEMTAQHMRKNA